MPITLNAETVDALGRLGVGALGMIMLFLLGALFLRQQSDRIRLDEKLAETERRRLEIDTEERERRDKILRLTQDNQHKLIENQQNTTAALKAQTDGIAERNAQAKETARQLETLIEETRLNTAAVKEGSSESVKVSANIAALGDRIIDAISQYNQTIEEAIAPLEKMLKDLPVEEIKQAATQIVEIHDSVDKLERKLDAFEADVRAQLKELSDTIRKALEPKDKEEKHE